MIALQILNKVLEDKKIDFILNNNLDVDYFIGYTEEYSYILDHYNKFKKVPDKETFLSLFPEFNLVTVEETDKYLLETINEEFLYYKSVNVLQKTADLLKTNSVDAIDYLNAELKNLRSSNSCKGKDIIKTAKDRLDIYKNKLKGEDHFYITTGFEELDAIIHGWSKGEELVIFFARIGQGKSWVLVKSLAHAWQIGYRVCLISPEMSAEKIGYRFDTLQQNFPNSSLVWGKQLDNYNEYIDDLKDKENPFFVLTPADFQRKITISKIKQFCEINKIDILGIDGMTYLTDERRKNNDNKTITLTNIAEDLFALSSELQIPVLTVIQSNRDGVRENEKGTPDIENIRDSDGPAQNATKIIALKQTGAGIEFGVKKHRDGMTGGKLIYYWDINTGVFNYIPSSDDNFDRSKRTEKVKEIKKSFKDGTEVF